MKKWLKRLKKDEQGLTLVELLAVVVILAIVAAIAFISIGKVIENSKKDAHISNAMQIVSAAKLYEASGGETDTDGIGTDNLDTLGELVDPWGDGSYSGNVSKDASDNYKVTLEGDKCKISTTESNLRNDDRETICLSGSGN